MYAITDPHVTPTEKLLQKVEAAIVGGCRILQYRNKSASDYENKDNAEQLLALCQRHNTKLIINDNVELAWSIGAHGVHLGQSDTNIGWVRKQAHEDFIIGATCHGSMELAAQAVNEGASYLAFGRFFPSKTKEHALPADTSVLTQATAEFSQPIVAIGGITLNNAATLVACGADCIAVSHHLFHHNQLKDVTAAAKKLSRLFN